MHQDSMVKLLKMLGSKIPMAQQRAGWFVASCPLAPWTHDGGTDKNPAFAVKKEPGDAFCTCFACGWHGPLSELLVVMRHRNKTQYVLDTHWGEAHEIVEQAEREGFLNLDGPGIEEILFGQTLKQQVFSESWLGSFPKWRDVPMAVQYVQERGLSPDVADVLDLRCDTDQQRVCFPVRDFKGVLKGFHGRAIHKDTDPRYRMYLYMKRNNPLVWLGESWVDTEKPIVVVEGPMDLASVYRVYRNVVSPLFATPSQAKILRMADALQWITLLDRGKGGDAGREKIAKALRRDHTITHLEPPTGRKDPGECSVEELQSLLKEHVFLDPVA